MKIFLVKMGVLVLFELYSKVDLFHELFAKRSSKEQ